jgi:hypothetical protein
MVAKIADDAYWSGIKRNQGAELIKKFKERFPGEDRAARVLDSVALMTPENIHLNAFMYEPIIDIGEDHLRDQYRDVKALT